MTPCEQDAALAGNRLFHGNGMPGRAKRRRLVLIAILVVGLPLGGYIVLGRALRMLRGRYPDLKTYLVGVIRGPGREVLVEEGAPALRF